MKITGLEVEGFGVWSGLRLSELSDQLNVVYGPNEAGKTTLMQFVRSILYGFSPPRRARYLPPVRDGRPGGSLVAVDQDETLVISRYADAADGLGQAVLADRQGFPLEEHRLEDLLGDVDEAVFNNVFALGLREIQELGTLSDTEAAHLLYDLTLGLDRVSLVEVLRELETSRTRLLTADDRPSLVVQLLAERERLRREIEELRQATPRYLELTRRRDLLKQETSQQQAESAKLDEKVRLVELAKTIADRWRARAETDRQLTALGPTDALPEDALGRLEKLNKRLASRRNRRKAIKRAADELRAEAAALAVNDPLARNAARLEALGEQQEWIASLAGQIRQLQDEIAELELGQEADRQQWGFLDKGKPPGVSDPPSIKTLAGLRIAGKALVGARRKLREVRGQIRQSRESAGAVSERIRSSLGNRSEQNLVHALERAGELVSRLRRRIQLDERLDQLGRRQVELDEHSHDLLDRQLLPTWVLGSLLGLFVFGGALILLFVAGLFLPASITGALGWPVALLGVGGTATAGLTKFFMETSARRQLDNCQKQLEMLGEQIEHARAERESLDAQLPRGGGPLVSRLQAAEKEFAALEELSPLEAERAAAEHEGRSMRAKKRDAGTEYRKAQLRWRQELEQAGYPQDLSPQQLRGFKERHSQISELLRQLEQRRGELAERRREFDGIAGRIGQLAADSGAKLSPGDPLGQLRALLAELHEQKPRVGQRDQLRRRIAKLRRKHLRCRHAVDRVRQRRKILMLEVGASNEDDFRRRAAAQAEIERLRAGRASLNQEIGALLAGQSTEEAIGRLISSEQGLAAQEQESRSLAQASRERLQGLHEKRGELHEQLRTLAEDRQLPARQMELGAVEQRLADAIDRWRVLAVCGLVLESVREVYERERQPAALREASKYFERLTGGRYTRVWTPLGEHVLKVDDAEGNALPVEVLSRGTREQLFLGLRLALVSSYAARGVRLPLVLDDVLVNFDATRAKAAATVLRDFAKNGFQLLVFTCHEHIARLFKAVRAEVRQLPDNTRPGQAEVMEQEPVKKPRRARAEPEPDEPAIESVAESTAEAVISAEAGDSTSAAVAEQAAPAIKAAPERLEHVLPRPHAKFPAAEPSAVPKTRAVAEVETIERVRWNAEEFDGELVDRVKRTRTVAVANDAEPFAETDPGQPHSAAQTANGDGSEAP